MLGMILLTHLVSVTGQLGAFLLPAAPSPTPPACDWTNFSACFQAVNDPLGWIATTLLNGPFQFINWLLNALMTPGNGIAVNFNLNPNCATGYSGGGNCIYFRLWQVGFGIGTGVLVLATGARALREVAGAKANVGTAIFGTLVRFILVLGLMSISYSALAWASASSFTMFYGLFHAFTTAGNTSPPAGWDVSSPTGGFIFLSTHLSQVGWGFVLYLMSFIGTIYVTWLILVARFVLLIGTAFAPVIIATSVYSEKAALFIWWSRKMIGALLVPMFAGAIMGVTTAIFWNLNPNLSTGTSWNPGSVVGVTASTPVALMLAVVSYVGGCWFLGQAIKHTTGLNLGAHSLSTMVAGGIGIQKIFGHGGPAQALFGMGAKGMEGVQALTTGSSNFIKDAKGAQMVDLPGASAAGGAGSGGATAFEAGSAMPTEIQNRLTALYQNTETVKNEITQSMPPAVVASIVGDKTGMDAITALVPEYIKTERGRDFLASGVFGAKTGV